MQRAHQLLEHSHCCLEACQPPSPSSAALHPPLCRRSHPCSLPAHLPTPLPPPCSALSIAVTVACVGLLLGLLAVVRFWSARGNRDGNGDATERLLYSHIPGTPSRAINTASARAAMSSGARSVPASNGPVPKKLSNLPA